MSKLGKKIIISGPSGSGKGTVVDELIKDENSILSISATTRAPRDGEVEGVDYFFKSKIEFEKMIKQNELLEYAEFCDNYYGTPKDFIENSTDSGSNVILEIEIEGALQVKDIYPEAIFVFIIPPSLKELKRRLVKRGSETKETIEKRLNKAKEELPYFKEYDYVVVNSDVGNTVTIIKDIIGVENRKSHYYKDKINNIMKER